MLRKSLVRPTDQLLNVVGTASPFRLCNEVGAVARLIADVDMPFALALLSMGHRVVMYLLCTPLWGESTHNGYNLHRFWISFQLTVAVLVL